MFSERLKELRNEKGLLQKELANILQVDQTTVSTWERGIREPDYEMLKKLSLYFEVSTDYLLGLKEI